MASTLAPSEHVLEGRAEDRKRRLAEMAAQRAAHERLDRPAHDVHGDGVRSDDDERKHPARPPSQVGHRVDRAQDQHHEPAAVERVGRGPDPLDDRAEPEPLKDEAGEGQRDAGEHESLQLLARASRCPEPLPCPEAQDHRRQRRDEAERGPAAFVESERRLTREEVQEPDVERPREVRVLVEVREESRVEMRPVRRDADARVVEVRRRQRIEDERRPERDEDDRERQRLHANGGERQQEQKRVAEADLREGVFEGPIRLVTIERPQEDAERHQRDAAPDRVPDHAAERLATRRAAARSRTAAPRRRETRTRAESGRAASSPATARASCCRRRSPRTCSAERRRAASRDASSPRASGTSPARGTRRSPRFVPSQPPNRGLSPTPLLVF